MSTITTQPIGYYLVPGQEYYIKMLDSMEEIDPKIPRVFKSHTDPKMPYFLLFDDLLILNVSDIIAISTKPFDYDDNNTKGLNSWLP